MSVNIGKRDELAKHRLTELPDRVLHTGLYGEDAWRILSYVFNDEGARNESRFDRIERYIVGPKVKRTCFYLVATRGNDDEVCIAYIGEPYDWGQSALYGLSGEARRKWLANTLKGLFKLGLYDRDVRLLEAQTTANDKWNAGSAEPGMPYVNAKYQAKSYSLPSKEPCDCTVGDTFKLVKALAMAREAFEKKYGAEDAARFCGTVSDPLTVEIRNAVDAEVAELKKQRDEAARQIRNKAYRDKVEIDKLADEAVAKSDAEYAVRIEEVKKQLCLASAA